MRTLTLGKDEHVFWNLMDRGAMKNVGRPPRNLTSVEIYSAFHEFSECNLFPGFASH